MSQDTCIVDDCEKPIAVRKHSLCRMHYQRKTREDRKNGVSPKQLRALLPTVCQVDGCEKPVRVKQDLLCSAHYQQKQATGDPLHAEKRQAERAARTTKTCNTCGEEKPLSDFSPKKLRSGNIGQMSACKPCHNEKNRAAYAANPGPTIERTAAYNKANPEIHRARARKSHAKRYAADPESMLEATRRWRRNNPDKVAELDRRKREKNPDLYKKIAELSSARRRARVAGAYFEDVDRDLVWSRDEGICHLCGLPADKESWDLDHIIPLAMGGSHSYVNAAVSHKFCNQSKNCRLVPSARKFLGAYVIRPSICP